MAAAKSILAQVCLDLVNLNAISTTFIVTPPDRSSNLKLVASWATNNVTEILKIFWFESGLSGHHWGCLWICLRVLGVGLAESDSHPCRPRTFKDIITGCDLDKSNARKIVSLIVGQPPNGRTREYPVLMLPPNTGRSSNLS